MSLRKKPPAFRSFACHRSDRSRFSPPEPAFQICRGVKNSEPNARGPFGSTLAC